MNNNYPYFSSGLPMQHTNVNYYMQPSVPYTGTANQHAIPQVQGRAEHYLVQSYPAPQLNFAPPVHEVLPQPSSHAPIQTNSFQTMNVQVQYPYPTQQTGYVKNVEPYFEQNKKPQQNMSDPYSKNFTLANDRLYSQPYYNGNAAYGNSFPSNFEKNVSNSFSTKKKHTYFGKQIENDLVKRTACIGNLDAGTQEFDDYFEIHVEKFFTPELHQLAFYHDTLHIYGIQFIYRDPWGKMDKETYKGNLNISKKVSPKSCTYSTFTLDFDEYLTELYVDGKDQITYFKFVTNEERVFEIGKPDNNKLLKNLVSPLTRIMGIGGSFDLYLNGLYFYYN